MKKAALIIGLILCVAAPLFAQGPFADVPTDHWAYEAVNQLQQDGILIGYPDGTFGGKRAMTRYEFAVAIARMIPMFGPDGPAGVSQADFNALRDRVTALEGRQIPDVSQLATKAEVEALRRLVDEFRDELAALGVDVDALKRDVAALNDRVTAIEKELQRFRATGSVDVIGTAGDAREGAPFDRDDRAITADSFDENISALTNVNLDIRAGLSDFATANVKGVFGNYLSWIGAVDDYSVFTRPDSQATGLDTDAALYFAYLDWGIGNGKLTFGRQPIQWSPYTLKMIDVDSYNNISYTDTGDYPMDAARFLYNFGSVKLDAFAAKNNEHELLVNGLTSQPTSGLFNDVLGVGVPFNVVGGHAAGGLATIDQSAGARLTIGNVLNGNIAASYMQAAGPFVVSPVTGGTFDSVDVFGADANFGFGSITLGANWAMTDTKAVVGADVEDDNQVIDGRLGFGLGKLGINAGWKRVESNFTAPGFWDKLGRWTNPVNIEGFYGDLSYGITSNVSLVAEAAFYEGESDITGVPGVSAFMDTDDDEVDYYTAGLKWGLSSANTVTLGGEWVNWQPAGAPESDEVYWNIGWGYQINPSAGFKLMYQIVDTDDDSPYGPASYEGNVAVAQFGVKF